MTTGFKDSGGTDLDSIFAPRGGLTPIANVDYRVGSQDLADRFAPVSFGQPAAAATGYKNSVGTDLQNVFAKIGSLELVLTISSDVSGFNATAFNVQTAAEAVVGVGNIPPLVRVIVEAGARVYVGTLTAGTQSAFPVPGDPPTTAVKNYTAMVSGTLPGSWILENRGIIMGGGGSPGLGGHPFPSATGSNGGTGGEGGDAVSTTAPLELINTGIIGGGGGGGGGSSGKQACQPVVLAPGKSGGAGAGAAPLTITTGSDGPCGGQINCGTSVFFVNCSFFPGGVGGVANTAGGTGGHTAGLTGSVSGGGGGGGAGAAGGGSGENLPQSSVGGAAGKAIALNGQAFTDTTPGTRYGAVS